MDNFYKFVVNLNILPVIQNTGTAIKNRMTSLELFDETLDINSTENYEMALQLGRDGFSFCLLDTLRNKYVLIRAFEPDDNKYYNSENIRSIIEKDDFLTRKYKKIRITMPSPRFTIIPSKFYDPARKNEYYSFNHRSEEGYTILSNKLTDPDAYVVYSVPTTIYELTTGYYPGVLTCVHVQPLFDYISGISKNINGNYVHLHIERDYFNLIIFRDKELLFCNTFFYKNISDILYFVMNVFKNLDINQEGTIFLSGVTKKQNELYTVLSSYIRTLKFAEPRGNFTFSYVFNEIEVHRYLNLFTLANCG